MGVPTLTLPRPVARVPGAATRGVQDVGAFALACRLPAMSSTWTGSPNTQLALALGITGGGIGLFFGILSLSSDTDTDEVAVVIVVSALALIGAALTTTKPFVTAILLLFAGIGGFIAYWDGTWMVPGMLLVGGAFAAWKAGQKTGR